MQIATTLQWIIPIAGVIAILFALYLARDVLRRDQGTQAMQDVAGTILEGAVAFIRRQYTTIALLALAGAVIIGLVIGVVENEAVADTDVFGLQLAARSRASSSSPSRSSACGASSRPTAVSPTRPSRRS